MALFKRKKEESKETKIEAPTKVPPTSAKTAQGVKSHLITALKQPRITEKATLASEHGAYVFEIDLRAGKKDVKAAFEAIYKVTPRKINIVPIPSKKIQSRFRGLYGVTSRGKKAYVYLKEGDTIDIV